MRNHEEPRAGSRPTGPIPLVAQVTTEQRQAEHYLVRSQKMEAIGQLAAGVAHDFNNLLTVIHAHASLHLADAQLDKEVVESLRQISLAAERASELTRRLLSFSRKQAERVQTLDLGRVLARTEPVLRRILGDSVVLTFIRPAKLPPVLGDGAAIEQIITDLVINAREALTEGGRIVVAAEALSLTAEAVRGNPEARPGCFVALSVIDNGCGIPPELLSRICEPFFTTKPVGNGTGLGLSTVP
jgi:two-component system, cell cycle sensor histidine kinase and response regulator CckA